MTQLNFFTTSIVLIFTCIGIGIGRVFGHEYINQRAIFGLIVGLVFAFTPYPFRFIEWLFKRKKSKRMP